MSPLVKTKRSWFIVIQNHHSHNVLLSNLDIFVLSVGINGDFEKEFLVSASKISIRMFVITEKAP